MNPLISVIVPCYNVEKYIEECLESIVNQSIGIDNMELVLIDDASSDQTLNSIMAYQQRYPQNIKVVALKENGGQANARNIGIDMATGEYFTFVDSDDWIEPDMYERMLKPARKYSCDMIQCAMVEHLEGATPNYIAIKKLLEYCEIHTVEERKKFFSDGFRGNMIGCTLYKSEWIQKAGIRFRNFKKYEDNYWMGLIKYSVNSYCSIPDYLYHYRVFEGSNSHSRNDERHFERLNVELERLNYYCEKGLFETYYDEIRKDFLENFYTNTLHIICCQFDQIPMEQIQMMQEVVKKIFPDYLEYVKCSPRFVNPVITVAFEFPESVWKQYKDAYYAWCAEGKEVELAQFYQKMRSALGLT